MSTTAITLCHGNLIPALSDYFLNKNIKNAFIIASKTGWEQNNFHEIFERANFEFNYTLFHDFTPLPTLLEVQAACQIANTVKAQVIIAIGGGTAIDLAKSVSVLMSTSPETAAEAICSSADISLTKACPLIAIPTTAGSGSEVTQFAAIYVDGEKYSLSSPSMMPDLSLVDGTMSYSTPQSVAASCALDALCQAIESFWAVDATALSQTNALKAIDLLTNNIDNAVLHKDPIACNALAEAAALAGQAINISKTTAAHAYSYYLSSQHTIQHGHAVSLCFPAVAYCNFHAHEIYLSRHDFDERFSQLFAMVEVDNINQFVSWFQSLMNRLGLSADLRQLGFDFDEEWLTFVGAVNFERLSNNPSKIDLNSFQRFLKEGLC